MPRTPRPYLPGAVFHVTARTQGHMPWFTPDVRGAMVARLTSSLASSDGRLLAYAVMPNHLHLVLQQGDWPLGRVLQPALRKIALLVQSRHGVEGHVFERRFRASPCLDPDYARNAIVYTNLNPVRAGLTPDAVEYPWTSHQRYADATPASSTAVDCLAGLRLFAASIRAGPPALRRSYLRYVAWRLECDAIRGATGASDHHRPLPPLPPLVHAAGRWSEAYAPLFCSPAPDPVRPAPRPDLRDIARRVLASAPETVDLARVRSRSKATNVVRIRRAMIIRMDAAGHSRGAIAHYARVSVQCVSHVLVTERTRRGRDLHKEYPQA